jgi:SAM-dependent methyltransferase
MKDNRWFAGFWSWATRVENKHVREVRRELVGGASGRVLEIGCGVGANFKYYTDAAREIVATDPNSFMIERARKEAAAMPRAFDIRLGRAEELPFDDASFDTVISTMNMCTIDDPVRALAEIKRVLKPGGEYRFFDHVAYDHAFGRFWQNLIDPLWSRALGAGCHLNRDIGAMVRSAGFTDVKMDFEKTLPPIPPMVLVRPHVKGIAVA